MQITSNILLYLGMLLASNDDITSGNLSHGHSIDEQGKEKGAKLIEESYSNEELNKDILTKAFTRTYGNQALNEKDRTKVASVIAKAANGHEETISKLLEKKIITPAEAMMLRENLNKTKTSSKDPNTHAKAGSHGVGKFFGPSTPSRQQHYSANTFDEQPKPEDFKGKPVLTTSAVTKPMTVPAAPASGSTHKISAEKPKLSEERQQKLIEEAEEKQRVKESYKDSAYNRSKLEGLTSEEAEANADAAEAYYDAYEQFLADGLTPQQADKKAKEIFGDPSKIAPNGQKYGNEINKESVIRKNSDKADPENIGSHFSSVFLQKAKDFAEQQEHLSKDLHKQFGKTVKNALEEDKSYREEIKNKKQQIKDAFKAIKDLKKKTITGMIEENNQKPGELEESGIKELVDEKSQKYRELAEKVEQTPKKTTMEDLARQEEKDRKMWDSIDKDVSEQLKRKQEEKIIKHQEEEGNRAEYEKLEEEKQHTEEARGETTYTEVMEEVMEETEENKQHEEALFKENVEKIIDHAGKLAYENVIQMGGTPEEAEAAKDQAVDLKKNQIEAHVEEEIEHVLGELSQTMDPETAKEMAKHIAIVHEIGPKIKEKAEEIITLMEGVPKPKAAEKKHSKDANKEEAVKDEKPTILSVISDTTKQIPVKNLKIDMPFKSHYDQKIDGEEELKTETIIENRVDQMRNTKTKPGSSGKPLYTGLPSGVDCDGNVLTLSEGVEAIDVKEGKITITEEIFNQMVKDGVDTTPFKKKTTDVGVTYELELENAIVDAGQDGNRENVIVKIGEETINMGNYPFNLDIGEGTINTQPFKDFRKFMRPLVRNQEEGPIDNEDEDPVEMDIIAKFVENQSKHEKDSKTHVEIHKDDKTGETVVTEEPVYGNKQNYSLEDAKTKAAELIGLQEDPSVKNTHVTFDMDDDGTNTEDGTQAFLDKAEKAIEGTKVEDKPFVVDNTQEVSPDAPADLVTDKPAHTHADGSPLTPEEEMDARETLNKQVQQAVNQNDNRAPQNFNINIGGMNGPDATPEQHDTTTTINVNQHGKPLGPEGVIYPSVPFNPSNPTPLQPTNQITEGPATHSKIHETYTQTIEKIIKENELPPTTPFNIAYNFMLKQAPHLADEMGTDINFMIKVFNGIPKELVEDLIEQMKNNAAPTNINITVNKIMKFIPQNVPGAANGFPQTIVNMLVKVISSILGRQNPQADIIAKVPVGRGIMGEDKNGQPKYFEGKPGTSQVIKKEEVDSNSIQFNKKFDNTDAPQILGNNYKKTSDPSPAFPPQPQPTTTPISKENPPTTIRPETVQQNNNQQLMNNQVEV